MEKENEKTGIEAGDFIKPGNVISMSTFSLVIWFLTGISYKLLTVLSVVLPYETYALVISLALSVAASILVVRKLAPKADLLMKMFIGLLNTILIYTSANGAQATYSYLSPVETSSSRVSQKAALIPFIDARPWIPDKFLKGENEKLTKENRILTKTLESLRARINQFNLRQGLWKQMSGQIRNNQRNSARLRDPAAVVRQQVNTVMRDSAYYDFLFLTPIR
jgi:hypothetical protein